MFNAITICVATMVAFIAAGFRIAASFVFDHRSFIKEAESLRTKAGRAPQTIDRRFGLTPDELITEYIMW